MNNLTTNKIGDTIYEAYWQELYAQTESWKLDLLFYQKELYFSHNLINKYNKWISKKPVKLEFQEIEYTIFEQIKLCNQLLSSFNKHLNKIANTISNPYLYDSYIFRKIHNHLETEFISFVSFYRKNRLKVFSISTEVVDNAYV